jgi:hypothetical protein
MEGAIVSLSSTNLNFGEQIVGITSGPQLVTLQNAGNVPLILASIGTGGTNSGDFAQTNNCPSSVAPHGSCNINVTFNPTVGGNRVAAVKITDNAPGSPQSVTLSGIGLGLNLGLSAGGTNSATVTAGGTATYTLQIGGGGLSGVAPLDCPPVSGTITCTVPPTVQVSSTGVSTFKVSVATTAPNSATLNRRVSSSPGWLWATALISLVMLPRTGRKSRAARPFIWLPLLLMLFTTCGGGGGGSGSGGTPPGTYILTVTASLGNTAQSQTLKLIVQ